MLNQGKKKKKGGKGLEKDTEHYIHIFSYVAKCLENLVPRHYLMSENIENN